MKLSTKTKYALSALLSIYMANEEKRKKLKNNEETQCCVSLSCISRYTNLPSSYLEQLFIKLKKANLISSTKGNLGGYVLTKDIKEISILDVMNAVGEKIEIGSQNSKGAVCCPTHLVWNNLASTLQNYFKMFTLKDIISGNYYTIKAVKARE